MAGFEDLYRMQQGRNNPLINVQQMQGRLPNWLSAPAPQNNNVAATQVFANTMQNIGRAGREQQGLDIKRQQASDLVDIQMQTFMAQQAKNKRAQAAREGYAAENPEFAAAILAGHGQQVASGLMKPEPKPGAPIAVIGPDGEPVYVSREDAVGKTPMNKAPLVSILPAPKLPQGYKAEIGPSGELVAKKIKGIDSAVDQAYRNTGTSLTRLEGLLNEYGTEIIPGEGKRRLATEYANLTIELKEMAKLGALTGPDLALVQDMVSDPTGMAAAVTPNAAFLAQIDQVRRILTEKMAGNAGTSSETNEPPPPPGFTQRVN